MNTAIISIITAFISSAAMAAIVQVIAECIRARRQDKQAISVTITQRLDAMDGRLETLNHAQHVILKDRIEYLGKNYIKNGSISLTDKQYFKEMCKVFKAEYSCDDHLQDIMEAIEVLEIIY